MTLYELHTRIIWIGSFDILNKIQIFNNYNFILPIAIVLIKEKCPFSMGGNQIVCFLTL